MARYKLDETDHQILDLLIDDTRTPFTKIAPRKPPNLSKAKPVPKTKRAKPLPNLTDKKFQTTSSRKTPPNSVPPKPENSSSAIPTKKSWNARAI